MGRTTTEILQSHLSKRLAGDTESDIEENFDENVLLLTSFGVYRGHDGVRASAAELLRELGGSVFHYNHTLIEDDFGFLEWTAESDDEVVRDGADSFVVRDERIVMQSIHYTARSRDDTNTVNTSTRGTNE
ncbi:nuclear transport factor 2 family protein [Microbacterium sp. STN6]|uniref:nuclear transport factor 2 family protein n=1 Tax=Microbacterium sp. STN6 TaxID=2995588 RepID=UPI0022609631|nr:nuclear transport factor 2 family protein [Microbacterium sp. STN6]MCX7522030.1 nuclear transport factor 2 family protein [Microbacterium sp. STN6]